MGSRRRGQAGVINTTTSSDGTRISYERCGQGPALILVDGALCSRGFGPSARLSRELEANFTVYRYDRRGRGESGDTQPYEASREVDDLAALIAEAGGSASLLGLSSGGALALQAAASGLPVEQVIAYEPPYVQEYDGDGGGRSHEAHLRRLIANGNRGGAVTYFMKDMVGAPAFVPIMMKLFFWMWPKLTAVAHTLPYDAAVMTGFRVPRGAFAAIDRPVLVLNGSKTDARLKAAAHVLAQTIPGASHAELAGQTHNVSTRVLAAAVRNRKKVDGHAVHHHS
jgi:pimeloyl-ACP methyl ester carboxylesterase